MINVFLISNFSVFFIILLGCISSVSHLFDQDASTVLVRLVFYIIMPVTLFVDIAQLPIHQILIWDYIGAYFLSYLSIASISILLSKSLFKRNAPNLIINGMASAHGNTAFIALPLFLTTFKTLVPVAIVIIIHQFFNFFILFGLDVLTRQKKEASHHRAILFVMVKNPIIIGTYLGLIFSYFHIGLPHVVHATCTLISHSASFIALFALGLSLGSSAMSFDKRQTFEIVMLIFLKTLLHPLAAFLIAYYVFGLSGFMLTAVTLMAAMPTAKNVFIFSERYRVAYKRANVVVLATTIVSMLVINMILLLL